MVIHYFQILSHFSVPSETFVLFSLGSYFEDFNSWNYSSSSNSSYLPITMTHSPSTTSIYYLKQPQVLFRISSNLSSSNYVTISMLVVKLEMSFQRSMILQALLVISFKNSQNVLLTLHSFMDFYRQLLNFCRLDVKLMKVFYQVLIFYLVSDLSKLQEMKFSILGITATRPAGMKHLALSFIYRGMVEFQRRVIVISRALDIMPVMRGDEIIYEVFFSVELRMRFNLVMKVFASFLVSTQLDSFFLSSDIKSGNWISQYNSTRENKSCILSTSRNQQMAQKIDALTSFSTVDDKITEMIFFLNLLETDPIDLPFLSLHFIKIGLYQQL